jgi:opacity protein-like surface antigen
MTRISLLAAASAFTLSMGLTAAAASPAGPYASGEAGASFMPDQDLTHTPIGTVNESLDTGYAFGGALGYDFGNGLRVELESLTTRADVNGLNGTPAGGHVDATGLMLNGKYDLMPESRTTPYVGVGLGFQSVGAKVAGLNGQNWEPAYQLEAGLQHQLSNKVSLFGEYRYVQSEANTISGGGISAHQHFSDNALLAGVTYHFGE